MLRKRGSRCAHASQYGRGMGYGSVLNFGDAFCYALARAYDASLLFVGDDFGTTDVAVAVDLH